MSKRVKIGNEYYEWDRLRDPATRRAILPKVEALIKQYKADPTELRELGWTDEDLKLAIRWTTGEFDNYSEEQMTKLTGAAQPASQAIDGKSAFREIEKDMLDPKFLIAKRRAENGQELTPAQKARVERHKQLVALNNEQHEAEKPKLPGRYPVEKKYVPASILELAKLPAGEQANRSREMRAAMRNDPKSAYNDEHHPSHAQAVHEMDLLYKAETYESGEPVLPDEPAK